MVEHSTVLTTVPPMCCLFCDWQAYGPGRLYRRTRSWNRYLFHGLPAVRRSGDSTLGFLFRLPDRLLGKYKVQPGGPLAHGAPPVQAARPMASPQQLVRDRWLAKGAQSGVYAASPLMQRARAARQKVAKRLPAASAALKSGKQKAGTLMSRGVLASRQVAGSLLPRDFTMGHIRHIRSTWSQTLPLSMA